jgi:hypothetical protein
MEFLLGVISLYNIKQHANMISAFNILFDSNN